MNEVSGRIRTRSDDETTAEGRRLAATLRAGDVVVLSGPLGAGKTVFVRGLAEGLGLDPSIVHSPTFAMVTEYGDETSRLSLVHADLYRIDNRAETEELGLMDSLEGNRVLAVEWGEKLPQRLRAGAIEVIIEDAGGDTRDITIHDLRHSKGPDRSVDRDADSRHLRP